MFDQVITAVMDCLCACSLLYSGGLGLVTGTFALCEKKYWRELSLRGAWAFIWSLVFILVAMYVPYALMVQRIESTKILFGLVGFCFTSSAWQGFYLGRQSSGGRGGSTLLFGIRAYLHSLLNLAIGAVALYAALYWH